MTLLAHPAANWPRHLALFATLTCAVPWAWAQVQAIAPAAPAAPADPVATLVGHLELEKYKATIKGLTAFGDRRQGTERNRKALDWIEAQLKAYGCTPTERLQYLYTEPNRRTPAPAAARARRWPGRAGRQHAVRPARRHRRQHRPAGPA